MTAIAPDTAQAGLARTFAAGLKAHAGEDLDSVTRQLASPFTLVGAHQGDLLFAVPDFDGLAEPVPTTGVPPAPVAGADVGEVGDVAGADAAVSDDGAPAPHASRSPGASPPTGDNATDEGPAAGSPEFASLDPAAGLHCDICTLNAAELTEAYGPLAEPRLAATHTWQARAVALEALVDLLAPKPGQFHSLLTSAKRRAHTEQLVDLSIDQLEALVEQTRILLNARGGR